MGHFFSEHRSVSMQQKTREVNKTDLRWWWIYCIGWHFVPKLNHYATGGALGLALVFSVFEPAVVWSPSWEHGVHRDYVEKNDSTLTDGLYGWNLENFLRNLICKLRVSSMSSI